MIFLEVICCTYLIGVFLFMAFLLDYPDKWDIDADGALKFKN